MEYTTFGNTGEKVSRIGFGGAPAGLKHYLDRFDPAEPADRRRVVNAIRRAVELGITYFDTAPGYGDGASEEIFGEGLEGADVFIATKITPGHDVRRSVEASLKRLHREYLDLVQIHGTTYPPEMADAMLAEGGMADQMLQLKQERLARYVGFTTEDVNEAVYRFIRSGKFDAMQICYNFIFQHAFEPTRPFGPILDAQQAGMGISTMRTATSGILQEWIRTVNPANEFDYTPALIQFVLSNPHVDVVLIGMRDAEMVQRNVAICNDTDGRIDIDTLHDRYAKGRASQ